MRYRLLGRLSGLRVSELALGAGMFGRQWGYGAERDEARRMLDGYLEAGGNFLDTADGYQFGESERMVGEFVQANRDDLVIATKYTMGAAPGGGLSVTGNSRKNLMRSVDASLARLGTDRIDLYWVHHPDHATPIEEILRGLDDLVSAGKILYAGLSNFPAWRVSRAVTLAQQHHWAPLIAQQIEYSLIERTPDRELLPMAEALGLGTLAWSPLGGGLLTGKYRRGEEGRAHTWKTLFHAEDDARSSAILDTLEAVAHETDASAGQVAIAWVMAKGLIPILGPRTRDQLDENLGATRLSLSAEQVGRLDEASAIRLGFPHEMLTRFDGLRDQISGGRASQLDLPSVPVA